MTISDSAVAGAVSGVSARFVTTPLDVIKIRFQLQIEPIRRNKGNHSSKYRGLVQATRKIIAEEGVLALWKGMIPGLIMYFLYGSIQFSSYDLFTKILQNQFKMENKIVRDFIGGSIGGSLATIIVQPLDVIRTRLVGQGEPKYYKTMRSCVQLMYRERGLRTFYRGLVPGLLMVTPQAGMHFGFYSLYKHLWRYSLYETTAAFEGSIGIDSLICGVMAGVSSKTIALPLDTVKKRLEVQGFGIARSSFGRTVSYNGVRDAFIQIWKEEGVFGFYKGALPGLLKASLSASISFWVYEYILHGFDNSSK